MSAPLKHIRVLDLSRVLAGPWAAQNLADMGAEVIKVEKPGVGDDTRGWGPPYIKDKDGNDVPQQSGYFNSANRGKKSIAIDISKAQGQALIKSLVKKCDVLIENFKVGALRKYGLSYEDLKPENPRLIYCSITGFGQTGPYKDRAGYDFMIQGMGGLMSITGANDAEGHSMPLKVGVAVADLMTGMYATTAILGALINRDQTGQGQYIDMALLDCQVAMLANQNMNYLLTGESPRRLGNAHPNIVPYQVFASKDGFIILAVGNDTQFTNFCKIAGCSELAADTRFQKNADRVNHREILVPLLEKVLQQHSTQLWLTLLEAGKIPCGPVNNLQQVFDDPQVKHRQMQREISHPILGDVSQVPNPIRYSDTPMSYEQAPPLLGEHTQAVLKDHLQLTPQEISNLQKQGIII